MSNFPDDVDHSKLEAARPINPNNRFRHCAGWHQGDVEVCSRSFAGIQSALSSVEVHVFAISGRKIAKEVRELLDEIITDNLSSARDDLTEAEASE